MKRSNDKALKNEENKVVQSWEPRTVRIPGKMIWSNSGRYPNIKIQRHQENIIQIEKLSNLSPHIFSYVIKYIKTALPSFTGHCSIVFMHV